MPHASGTNSYPDARALMDRALEKEKGIEVELASPGDAFRMRMNCYAVRKRDKKSSLNLFPPGHPRHGNTPYDELTFITVGSKLKILKLGALDFAIKEIQ